MLFRSYNQVIGLPAAWVGAAIMIAMVADAALDWAERQVGGATLRLAA